MGIKASIFVVLASWVPRNELPIGPDKRPPRRRFYGSCVSRDSSRNADFRRVIRGRTSNMQIKGCLIRLLACCLYRSSESGDK